MGDFDEMRRLVEDVPYVPSLLNFPTGNTDKDWIDFGNQYVFTGEFYVEIDFEYSALTSSYAGVMGNLTGSFNDKFRILVNNTTVLATISDNSNITASKSSSYNTRFTLKLRRDASNNIKVSYNGGAETTLGNKSGTVIVDCVSNADNNPRFLQGKVYKFDINGDVYNLTEGSGDKVYGTLGGVGTIKTDNINGLAHINNDMWEAL
jgi:hypothetical protein